MMKKLILGLGLLSSVSFAGEDLNSTPEEKFETCVVKSDVLKDALLKMCSQANNASCSDRVEKLWQRMFESCVRNSDSDEIKQRYLMQDDK